MKAGRILACAAAALLVAGCGDPALWARWRAERGLWHANREMERIGLKPALAGARDWDRAAAAFERVSGAFPIERWSGPDAPGDSSIAHEVGLVSGRALLGRAAIELYRGRPDSAAALYARTAERGRALPEIAREAAAGCARALVAAGRSAEARPWWDRVAREYDVLDPATGEPLRSVLEGIARAADARADAGDPRGADSVRARAVERLEREIAARAPAPPAEAASRALADLRLARGDAAGYRAAMRDAIGRAPGDRAAALAVEIATVSLERGEPDTARTYATWAAGGFGGAERLEGMRLVARSWEAAGQADSALAAWASLLEAYPKAQDAAAESRFRRGVLYEGLGHWELARSELRALVASQPSHPLALEAVRRVVLHHVNAGELELARLEGRRAVEALDELIATQHDAGVQRAARSTRAAILTAVEDWPRACDAYADLWLRWPGTPLGDSAAWRAADLAEVRLHDPARADSLLRELAGSGADSLLKARARARLAPRGRS